MIGFLIKSSMESLIIEIISELSDIDTSKIKRESKFIDLGFDYLDIAELVMNIEDKLNVRYNDSVYYAKTVAELIEKVEKFKI